MRGPIPTLASKLNRECGRKLRRQGVITDTKTDSKIRALQGSRTPRKCSATGRSSSRPCSATRTSPIWCSKWLPSMIWAAPRLWPRLWWSACALDLRRSRLRADRLRMSEGVAGLRAVSSPCFPVFRRAHRHGNASLSPSAVASCAPITLARPWSCRRTCPNPDQRKRWTSSIRRRPRRGKRLRSAR